MRLLLATLLVTSACAGVTDADPAAAGGGKGDVWGSDDRVERYEIETPALQDAARSSAATFRVEDLVHDEMRDVYSAPNAVTLESDQSLCDGQRYEDQPAAAWCSATLIGDDIMVSAGHCFEGVSCDQFYVVFDFAYDRAPTDPMAAAKDIPAANVYRCTEMLASEYNVDYDTERGADFAVFRLDRKVVGREPAKVNWSGELPANQPAYAIGHPSRIPQKMSIGSVIDSTTSPDFFEHDADVFGGNSGCGVFDKTGTLIGIHDHSSAQRYTWEDGASCSVVAVCGENVECPRKPHAYDTRALKSKLSPELQMQLGIQ